MVYNEIKIKGAYIIEPRKIEDDRGFFTRTYCKKEMAALGFDINMVQTNVSYNKVKGTLRGLHMQSAPFGEAKLVRCTKGAIFDVLVDMREDSPTYLQWFGVKLTADNYKLLFIPSGCAHGYLTLEDASEISYQVSEYYTPGAEKGFLWNDPAFGIEWPIKPVVISEKDKLQPLFALEQVNTEPPDITKGVFSSDS